MLSLWPSFCIYLATSLHALRTTLHPYHVPSRALHGMGYRISLAHYQTLTLTHPSVCGRSK